MVPRLVRPSGWLVFLLERVLYMLEKKYNHKEVEEGKYESWLQKCYFACDSKSDKKLFCIVLPPLTKDFSKNREGQD